jgi:hypothetical protein
LDAERDLQPLASWLGLDRSTTSLLREWLALREQLPARVPDDAETWMGLLERFRVRGTELEQLLKVSQPQIAEEMLRRLALLKQVVEAIRGDELRREGWEGRALGEELRRRRKAAITAALEERL